MRLQARGRCRPAAGTTTQRSIAEQGGVAHGALVGAGGEQGVGLQRAGDLARARRAGLPAPRVGVGAALGQGGVIQQQIDATGRDVDADAVAVFDQADDPAAGRFRRDVADRQARRTAGETTIGQQCALLAQPLRLQTRAGPSNTWIDSSTPAVFTTQPSTARLPRSTASPPSSE
ncbi:hypothetical protein G6F35_016044 [Rhizopus arrhizus]|nr:hypothetical protein G6F35_016044 [Rhizopus arrhizus]